MSFFDKAKQAAEQAAEQAKIAATQAGIQAKAATEQMKRSLTPERLADLIIKATALQERTNSTLRAKGSPYRITEISVTAAIPPNVGFVIGRMLDPQVSGDIVESTEILGRLGQEAVLELDAETAGDATTGSAAATSAGMPLP